MSSANDFWFFRSSQCIADFTPDILDRILLTAEEPDFFYNLPDMMKQAAHADKSSDINNVLMTLIDNQSRLLNMIAELNDRHRSLLDTVYEICPGLMIIEEVADDQQERKRLLRKYMNTAVNSDDSDDILDWVFMQENRPDE